MRPRLVVPKRLGWRIQPRMVTEGLMSDARRRLARMLVRSKSAKKFQRFLAESANTIDRLSQVNPPAPVDPASVRRVNVGSGAQHQIPGWTNVDIRAFPGLDAVMDVTKEWPFTGLEYVYGEHFLEHLELDDALHFLANAGVSLQPGGVLRQSTPNLDWAMLTQYPDQSTVDERVMAAYRANRLFHGWGHKFLFNEPILRYFLERLGFEDIRFFDYGESDHEELRGLERHQPYEVVDGHPSVINVEAVRGEWAPAYTRELAEETRKAYRHFLAQ
jgi:predicted SAM-dependent methyltransferase